MPPGVLAFTAVMVSTMIVTVTTILHAMGVNYDGMTQNEMIGKLIKQADYACSPPCSTCWRWASTVSSSTIGADARLAAHPTSATGSSPESSSAIAVIFLGQRSPDGQADLLGFGVASAAVIATGAVPVAGGA
jgi:hypothetical protein